MNQKKRIVPAFATEAEEVAWRLRNRDTHGAELLAGLKNGEAQVLTKEKLLERLATFKRRGRQW